MFEEWGRQPLAKSFNSLQTGKRIQSLWKPKTEEDESAVSIPFKRESGFKAPFLISIIYGSSPSSSETKTGIGAI